VKIQMDSLVPDLSIITKAERIEEYMHTFLCMCG
jgi:hypothetical protein